MPSLSILSLSLFLSISLSVLDPKWGLDRISISLWDTWLVRIRRGEERKEEEEGRKEEERKRVRDGRKRVRKGRGWGWGKEGKKQCIKFGSNTGNQNRWTALLSNIRILEVYGFKEDTDPTNFRLGTSFSIAVTYEIHWNRKIKHWVDSWIGW